MRGGLGSNTTQKNWEEIEEKDTPGGKVFKI